MANASSPTRGLSRSDQIALGVGISMGMSTLIAAILGINNRYQRGGVFHFKAPQQDRFEYELAAQSRGS